MSKTRTEISRDWYKSHPDYQRERYAANREKMLAWRRAYRKARKAEGRLFPSETKDRSEYQKAYREANKEVIKERVRKCRDRKKDHYIAVARAACRRYRLEHPEEARARDRAYSKANRHKRRIHEQRRRAKKRGAQGNGWTDRDVCIQFVAQKGRCFYCKKKLGEDFHRDHVIPLARGGRHDRSNLVLACPPCNQKKWSHGPEVVGLLL